VAVCREVRKEMVLNYEVILKFLFVATNTERSDVVSKKSILRTHRRS